MTIKDLIQFLEKSAANCDGGLDTNLKTISLKNGYGSSAIAFTDSSVVSLEKHLNSTTGNEYVNLVIEEDEN